MIKSHDKMDAPIDTGAEICKLLFVYFLNEF